MSITFDSSAFDGDTFDAGVTGILHGSLSQPLLSTLHGHAGVHGTLNGTLNDPLTSTLTGKYDLAVTRGPFGRVTNVWHEAVYVEAAVTVRQESPQIINAAVRFPLIDSTFLQGHETPMPWVESVGARNEARARYQEALQLDGAPKRGRWQEGAAMRAQGRARHQEGLQRDGAPRRARWQETTRIRTPGVRERYQEARRLDARPITSVSHDADGLVRSWVIPWQEAGLVQPGKSTITPVVPPVDLCYTPPIGSAVPLVFTQAWNETHDATLTFVCDNHPIPGTIIVPIQEVYMQTNTCGLTLDSDGTVIPCSGFTLTLDYKSWTWSFSAQVPYAVLSLFGPDTGGAPKVINAEINGTAFKIVAESIQSARAFPTGTLTLTGRGIMAGLDVTYQPVLTFDNSTAAKTAQQIANDVLTVGGVSIGWTVEWNITDWLVPENAWTYQGVYIGALQSIAASVGAYLQPTPASQTVRFLPYFPGGFAPWDWALNVTPDVELPSSVITIEGISWSDNPLWNRVFVSGTNDSGLVVDATRTGTAGDLEKPMVTDQLITHVDAGRQRAIAEIGTAGRSALVSLKLPVLDATGVILPGKSVRYVDGSTTRLGVVRSVAVDVKFPAVYQTIGVETYV